MKEIKKMSKTNSSSNIKLKCNKKRKNQVVQMEVGKNAVEFFDKKVNSNEATPIVLEIRIWLGLMPHVSQCHALHNSTLTLRGGDPSSTLFCC